MKSLQIKEIRKISADAIRALCITNGWYTRGSNVQYANLLYELGELKENLTTKDIVEIAVDIIAHSEIEADGRTEAEVIESVAFEIMRVCDNFIIIAKED